MKIPDEQGKLMPRRCPIDQRVFVPKRITQVYCKRSCRKTADRLKQVGAGKPQIYRRALSLPAVLARVADERSVRGLPELHPSEYLAAHAAVVEAQLQLQTWQGRLAERQKALKALPDPGYLMRRIVLRPGQPLDVPEGYGEIGAIATEPSLAVVFLGRPDEHT